MENAESPPVKSPLDGDDTQTVETKVLLPETHTRGKKVVRKDTPGRPAFEGGTLEKHSILVQPDLWAWAQAQPKGPADLIRKLLEQERGKQAEAPKRPSMTVSTTGGHLLVSSHSEGINILFESMLVLNFSYNPDFGCHMAYVPARVERLDDRVARHRAERAKAKAQSSESPAEDKEPHLSASENTIDDEKE